MFFKFCTKNLVKHLHMKKGGGGSDSHMVETMCPVYIFIDPC